MNGRAAMTVKRVVLAMLAAVSVHAADKRVAMVAYINQQFGCQKHTETFLAELSRRYGDRVSLELVDFGGEGRVRWQKEGMHCMGIRLNGSTQAGIVYRGVPLTVRFEMPAGYMWTHDELATAVRQMLEGVTDADRRPPEVEVRQDGGESVLLIGGQEVMRLADRARIESAAKVLREAQPAAIIQEEFALKAADGTAAILLRGQPLITWTAADVGNGDPAAFAGECFKAVAGAYPRKSRPFPGQDGPGRRQQP